ncbi:MAG: HAMP domain-containing histidine kinase [Clostridia bacterium]|nr:HAMP domain-containing histidine kinase [Clostridia bacterium]
MKKDHIHGQGSIVPAALLLTAFNALPYGALIFAVLSGRTGAVDGLRWVLSAAAVVMFAVTSASSVFILSRYGKARRESVLAPLREIQSAIGRFTEGAGYCPPKLPEGSDPAIICLSASVDRLMRSVSSLEEMRQNFMSSVSHDMRTPMTTITGFIDCILDGAVTRDREEHYLRLIKSEILRLSRLVSSMLDISRIQAGDREFTFTPFNICENAKIILFSFENAIDAKKLEVSFDAPRDDMFVMADSDAIYQVMYNIIDNAVKFSREGGKLEISVSENVGPANGSVPAAKSVRFSVYNDGEGIAYEDQPFVFDRFFKADRTRGLDKNGVGLGMYISKKIIDAHGSELKLESVPGIGCRFYFDLRAAPERDVMPAASARAHSYDNCQNR